MKLHVTIEKSGKNTTGIEIPPEVVEALGAGKRPRVQVTINGYTYRSSIASMGGRFMLSVSAEVRENAGVSGGDAVDIDLELDTAPARSGGVSISRARWMPPRPPARCSTRSPSATGDDWSNRLSLRKRTKPVSAGSRKPWTISPPARCSSPGCNAGRKGGHHD